VTQLEEFMMADDLTRREFVKLGVTGAAALAVGPGRVGDERGGRLVAGLPPGGTQHDEGERSQDRQHDHDGPAPADDV